MAKSKPYELVMSLEDEIEKRTGREIRLLSSPAKGRELGSAKHLLAYLDGDLDRAIEVVNFWLDMSGRWWRAHSPSLAVVYSQVAALVFRMEMRKADAVVSYLRSGEPEIPGYYLRDADD